MLLQRGTSYFILATIKEVESNEARSNWTLMKNSEVKSKHKNKDSKLKTVLSIWSFKRRILLYLRLINNKDRICTHRRIKQWVVNHWEAYATVVNWIIVR